MHCVRKKPLIINRNDCQNVLFNKKQSKHQFFLTTIIYFEHYYQNINVI
jgi:hypothetical protein